MRHILLFIVLCLAACSTDRPIILLEPDTRSYTLDQLSAMEAEGRPLHVSHWWTAEELDWVARSYADREGLDFSFNGVTVMIWVPRNADFLARVEYFRELGKPVLSVWIGFGGDVLRHSTPTAIDGPMPVQESDLDEAPLLSPGMEASGRGS